MPGTLRDDLALRISQGLWPKPVSLGARNWVGPLAKCALNPARTRESTIKSAPWWSTLETERSAAYTGR